MAGNLRQSIGGPVSKLELNCLIIGCGSSLKKRKTQSMASSFGCSTPSRLRSYHTSTTDDAVDGNDGRWLKCVTFDTNLPSHSDIHDRTDIENAVGQSRALLGTKMGTPYYNCKRNPSSSEDLGASVVDNDDEDVECHLHPVDVEKEPPRLIESGAVRVHIAQYTNPRRGADKNGSTRLIDQGALRLQITRHTTPRKKVNATTTQCRMMSSSNKIMVPQTDIRPIRRILSAATTTTTSKNGFTPSEHRSNAHIGGHKFRAALSPNTTTPYITAEIMDIENEENSCIRNLPRKLRFE